MVCYSSAAEFSCRRLTAVISVTEARLVNPLDLDLVDLEVKRHFRIRKVQPEVWYRK
jgi:hypothetical protein